MKSEAVQGCGSELTVTGSFGVNAFNWIVIKTVDRVYPTFINNQLRVDDFSLTND